MQQLDLSAVEADRRNFAWNKGMKDMKKLCKKAGNTTGAETCLSVQEQGIMAYLKKNKDVMANLQLMMSGAEQAAGPSPGAKTRIPNGNHATLDHFLVLTCVIIEFFCLCCNIIEINSELALFQVKKTREEKPREVNHVAKKNKVNYQRH